MRTLIKSLVVASAALALATAPISAQEFGVQNTAKANHFTTKTTWTPTTSTVRLYSIVVNTSAAGTAWTLTVTNKESTAKTVVSALTLATSQNPLVINFGPAGILMTSGIDVVTGGTTAGTADVWVTYR